MYVPNHLLCKTHGAKALGRSNFKFLPNIEKELYMQMKHENINPSMISLFRGKKVIIVAGIKCLINLINHKKSASASNIADKFNFIME